MLIFKGVLVIMALFLIGSLIYMLAAPRLIRAPGVDIISTNSPFLWMAFAISLAIRLLYLARGLWVFQGVMLGLSDVHSRSSGFLDYLCPQFEFAACSRQG